MCTHQAQNRIKIVNPHILAILRAKCTQEKWYSASKYSANMGGNQVKKETSKTWLL